MQSQQLTKELQKDEEELARHNKGKYVLEDIIEEENEETRRDACGIVIKEYDDHAGALLSVQTDEKTSTR